MNVNDIKELLAQMAQMDFGTAPSLRFAAVLRDKVAARLAPRFGWSTAEVEEFVLKMDISLNMVEFSDADLDEMAESFYSVIEKMVEGLQARGFTHPGDAIKLAAPRLSLKLS